MDNPTQERCAKCGVENRWIYDKVMQKKYCQRCGADWPHFPTLLDEAFAAPAQDVDENIDLDAIRADFHLYSQVTELCDAFTAFRAENAELAKAQEVIDNVRALANRPIHISVAEVETRRVVEEHLYAFACKILSLLPAENTEGT